MNISLNGEFYQLQQELLSLKATLERQTHTIATLNSLINPLLAPPPPHVICNVSQDSYKPYPAPEYSNSDRLRRLVITNWNFTTPQVERAFAERIVKGAGGSASSLCRVSRRRPNHLILEFDHPDSAFAVLRGLRERNNFKIVPGACRISRDFSPEELSKYFDAKQRCAQLNKSGANPPFFVDDLTLEIKQHDENFNLYSSSTTAFGKPKQASESVLISANPEIYDHDRWFPRVEWPQEFDRIEVIRDTELRVQRGAEFPVFEGIDTLNFCVDEAERSPRNEELELIVEYALSTHVSLAPLQSILFNSDVFCPSELLTKIAASLYNDENWKVIACRFKKVIFMNETPTGDLQHSSNGNSNDRFYSLQQVKLGKKPLQVLTMCPVVAIRNGVSSDKVGMKKVSVRGDFDDSANMKLWLESRFCGFEEYFFADVEDGRFVGSRWVNSKDLARGANTWSGRACLRFLCEILERTEEILRKTPDFAQFAIEKNSKEIRIYRESNTTKMLPMKFVKRFLKNVQ